MHVLIMAGGTGGHVYPGLAVARALRAMGGRVSWLGTSAGIESRVVPVAGLDIRFEAIDIRGLRRHTVLDWLLLIPRLVRATWQARSIFRRLQPDAVLSMGGYVAAPGGLVAWLRRIPLVLHEQNAVPGMTNRWLSLLARRVLTGFPSAFARLPNVRHVGNPVRSEIRAGDVSRRFAGRQGGLRLLVIGGSQGARVFNETVPLAIAQLETSVRPEVWHQCGRGNREATEARYAGMEKARVSEFIDDMAAAYRWADLVVARSGAMTLAELSAAGVPSVLVPYPYATDDHQTANARFLAERGAAMLMPQDELTAARLAEVLRELTGQWQTLAAMAASARECDMPDAAETVAAECQGVIRA